MTLGRRHSNGFCNCCLFTSTPVTKAKGLAGDHAYGVPTNTVFTSYPRRVKYIIPIIHGTKNVFKPNDAIVIESIRSSISRQYPPLILTLLPGVLMTTADT